MKKALLGKSGKVKRVDAITAQAQKLAFVPSPHKYDLTQDWEKKFPSKNYGRFLLSPRDMLSDDIEKEAKKKTEKLGGKNPGPSSHHSETAWRKQSQLPAAFKYSQSRDQPPSSLFDTAYNHHTQPSPDKYDKVPFDRYAKGTKVYKIHTTHLPRFKPTVKNTLPSPATYKVEDAVAKSQWISTQYSVGKDATPRTYFDNMA